MDKCEEIFGHMKEIITQTRDDYISWIVKNPSRASDTESSIKLISYLLHGRMKKASSILPELIYCSANLLTFWHDHLINQHNITKRNKTTNANGTENLNPGASTSSHNSNGLSSSAQNSASQREARNSEIQRIKSALTIIDYLEVFLEVSARQLWGDFGRWVVIILVQSIKTGLRGALLLHYQIGMIGSTTVHERLGNRKRSRALTSANPNMVFVLKHSGRAVRKIHAAPPLGARDWSVPTSPDNSSPPEELPPMRMLAEVIHLLRPLSHLVCMGYWGRESWKPLLLSLSMDLSSLQLHRSEIGSLGSLRKDEKIELTRRGYSLCYYLLRSPFYDTYTKQRLLSTLTQLAGKIPIVGTFCGALAQAIPQWQSTYSYIWTDY